MADVISTINLICLVVSFGFLSHLSWQASIPRTQIRNYFNPNLFKNTNQVTINNIRRSNHKMDQKPGTSQMPQAQRDETDPYQSYEVDYEEEQEVSGQSYLPSSGRGKGQRRLANRDNDGHPTSLDDVLGLMKILIDNIHTANVGIVSINARLARIEAVLPNVIGGASSQKLHTSFNVLDPNP